MGLNEILDTGAQWLKERRFTPELTAMLARAIIASPSPARELDGFAKQNAFASIILGFFAAGDPLSKWFQHYTKWTGADATPFLNDLKIAPVKLKAAKDRRLNSRWREMGACHDNTCGESKGQNSHDNLLDLTFLIAATDPKASIY